jgi:hypothetical protein
MLSNTHDTHPYLEPSDVNLDLGSLSAEIEIPFEPPIKYRPYMPVLLQFCESLPLISPNNTHLEQALPLNHKAQYYRKV